MNSKTNRTIASLGLFAMTAMTACAAPTHDLESEPVEDTATTASAIKWGYELPAGYREMVLLAANGFGCSGTLLTNRLVLTAKHCIMSFREPFIEAAPVDPNVVFSSWSITAFLDSQKSGTDLVLWHPTMDVAVVRLRQPFAVGGSTLGYVRQVRSSYVAAGEWVACYGYGNLAPSSTCNGCGTLRTSTNMVTSSWGNQFTVASNWSAQLPLDGDSGGPCMSGEQIAGVMNTSDDWASAGVGAASAFKPWVDEIRSRFANGNDVNDGVKIRDNNGGIYVAIAGGMFAISSWDEFVRDWSAGPIYQTGPFGMVRTPRDGVALRDPGTGEIDVVIGGRRWWITSWSTYVANYASWPLYTVPRGSLGAIPFGGYL